MNYIKWTRLSSVIFMTVLFCYVTAFGGSQSSANYLMKKYVLNGGSQGNSSASFDMIATLAQSTVIGRLSSQNYKLYSGFFSPPEIEVSPGNINNDASVDLTDALLSLQVIAGASPSVLIYRQADVNGDHQISTAETAYIMQKIAGLRLEE